MSLISVGIARIPNAPEQYDMGYTNNTLSVIRLWMGSVLSLSVKEVADITTNTTTAVTVTVGLSVGTYLVSTLLGATTVTLPDPTTVVGRTFVVKRTTAGANTLTVIAAVAGTIDGAANALIPTQWQTRSFQSNGTNYFIVGSYL